MKWAILLGSPDISGGSYVIYEHAVRAARRGMDVCIITREKVAPERLYWHPEARELAWKTFEEAESDEFDIAVATWWRTVYDLHRVRAKTYCYFVQSIESRFCREHEIALRKFVDSTYMLPLPVVTEASWIREYLKANYGLASTLVRNGVRKDIYSPGCSPHSPRVSGRLRVLVEGSLEAPFKNVARTIELCRRSGADEVWLLTLSPVEACQGVDRVFSRVRISETPRIYGSCDVIVKLSYVEGMFGPPLEMFHCGGTAIVYDVTGHDEYIRHGYNALVAKTDDEAQVVRYIDELKNDPALLERLKKGALETADAWPDWEASSLEFSRALKDIASSGPSISRELLGKKTGFFMEYYDIANSCEKKMAPLLLKGLVRDPVAHYLYRKHPGLHSLLKRARDFFLNA